ncbi:MAG: hypothetical protein JWQ95_1970 [Sphaerisporangium sp.]|nr:hypothetical protein [Sphaerisporangium sp.]
MTQNLESAVAPVLRTEDVERPRRESSVSHRPRRPRQPWWRSPWVIGLAVVVVFNLIYALPRYLSFNPAMSRAPLAPGFPAHFAVISVHAVLGNVALVTVFLQVMPWLRRRSVKAHRVSGLVYVFGGAIPAAVLSLVLLPFSTIPTGKVGLFTMAVLWIATTLVGYRKQRQGRYAEHRRWMLYSFAMALGTTWGRVVILLWGVAPALQFDVMIFLELNSWMWFVNLLIVQWWLERRPRKAVKATV